MNIADARILNNWFPG